MQDAPTVDMDAFLPRAEKIVQPFIIPIANGTTYTRFQANRPVILQALTPASVGTIYAYPLNQPANDDLAIPSITGQIFLDATGVWYVRHTGGSTQYFRVVDGGGAGNAQALMDAAAPNSYANLNARLIPVTWGTAAQQTIGTTSTEILAASTTRRALRIRNASTGGQRMTVRFGAAAVIDTGGFTYPQGTGEAFNPLDMVSQQSVNVIFSAAGGVVEFTPGT